MTDPYASGRPEPLTHAERALLPELLRYADRYRYSRDGFDQNEAVCDAINQQREWLADRARGFVQAGDAVARFHSSECAQ